MLHYQYNLKELIKKLEEQGDIDEFIRDIFRFNLLVDELFGIEETLFDAHIDKKGKIQFINDTIAPHIGKTYSDFLINLVNNDDIIFYHMITKKFLALIEKEKDCLFVEIISAEPMNQKYLIIIKEVLEHIVKQPLYVYNSTNKTLLGGFLVKYGEKTVDLTVKEALEKLKFSLMHS